MKLHCNIIKDLLPLYLENECSEESRKLVEAHLKECETCSQLVNELKQDEEIPFVDNSKEILKKTSHKIITTILKRGFILLFIPILWILYCVDIYQNRFTIRTEYTELLGLSIVFINVFILCWIIVLIFSSFAERNFKENRLMVSVLIITILMNQLVLHLPYILIDKKYAYNVPIQKIEGNKIYVYHVDEKEIVEIEMSEEFMKKNQLVGNDGMRIYDIEWKESSLSKKCWLNDARVENLSLDLQMFRNRDVIDEQYLDGYMLSCMFGPYYYRQINQVNEKVVEVHDTTWEDVEYVEMIQEVRMDELDDYWTYEIGTYEKNAHYTTIINKNTLMIVGYKIY